MKAKIPILKFNLNEIWAYMNIEWDHNMKKSELQQKLINENITSDAYSLEGGLPNEAYCLNQDGNVWEAYYSERGQKSGLKSFAQEDGACDYFYHSLISMLHDMGLR